MKGILLSISLLTGGLAATNDGVQDVAKDYYNRATEQFNFGSSRFGGFMHGNYGYSMHDNYGYGMHGNYDYEYTEEMQEFRDYQINLVRSYDFSNMTTEEIQSAESEINELLDQKANELGLELPSFTSGFGPGMMYGYASDEQTELMYYMHELMFSYDWNNMTDSEIEVANESIDNLIKEKANELGLENYGFVPHMGGFGQHHGGFGYRSTRFGRGM